MKRKCCIAIAVLAVVGLCSVARAEAPSVLLEKAVYAEETVGDLDAAIELYGQVIADAEANRATLAQAHYRLASCYLKKGQRREAIEELRKLVARYPGQVRAHVDRGRHLPAAGPIRLRCPSQPP